MKNIIKRDRLILAMAVTLFTLMSGPSVTRGVTYDLVTGEFDKLMSDGATVHMWGFGLSGQAVTVPGPALTVPVGDSTLTIHLTDHLSVPVSLVIPGLPASLTPVYHPVGDPYAGRVRSLTTEAVPGGGMMTYTWTNVRPGTFVYHSGTQMQIQMQMGLYGAVKHDFAAMQAYDDPATSYQTDIVLLYSEVDPAIHAAVQAGSYGPSGTTTSTVSYWPSYFLINGESYTPAQSAIPAGIVGQKVLLRFLNAGLRTHVPIIHNHIGKLISEDGNLLPFFRDQYEVMLAAGKTSDLLLTPAEAGQITVYDRKLDLTTGLQSSGGMLVKLDVAPVQTQPGLWKKPIRTRLGKI